jgi:nucleotide-binding universal stress UspA family protein
MLDHQAAANGLLAAAVCLAELVDGAHINVLVARVPPASTIMPTEEVLTRDTETRLRAQEAARAAALRAIFDAWNAAAGRPDGTTEWFECEAVAHGLIAERGRRADVIVVERPERHDHGTTWQALPAALFETDRPVLVVPPGPPATFGRRVAIAWRDDPHATRAVLSALRYARPGASVHLLAGMRPGSAKPAIPEILVEHGIAADLQIIPIGAEPFGSTLLARAHDVGADMLVMGAYAHSPLRELILGGVTRHVMAHTDLPVLMRH